MMNVGKQDLFVIIVFASLFLSIEYAGAQNTNISYTDLYASAEKYYYDGKLYEAAEYYEKAAVAMKNLENADLRKISDAYGNAASCYYDLGKFEKTIEYCEIALVFSKKINDSSETSTHYSNIGQACVYLGKYDEAISAFQQSLEIDRGMGNDEGISTNLNSIGKVYEIWQRYNDAITFYEQALSIAKNIGNKSMIAIRLSGLGTAYKSLGEYDKSLRYQEQALEIEKEMNNKPKIGVRLDYIGEVYQLKKEYARAEYYFIQALKLVEESDKSESKTNFSKAIILSHLAKNYYLKGNQGLAIQTYSLCLELSKEIKFSNILIKCYKELSELYKEYGDYKKAYNYYDLFVAERDSAFNAESRKQINNFREKYETERKEKQIVILTKEKEVNEINLKKSEQQKLYIAGIVILMIILSGVIYSRYRFKRRANIQLAEQNLQLQTLNASKDRFFAIISHDLKSPITSFERITGALKTSLDNVDRETLKEFIHDMNNAAISLSAFLKKLLHWAMSQTGKLTPEKTIFPLSDALNNVLSASETILKERTVKIEMKIENDHPVMADRSMIETVIRNLLTNAVKFCDNTSPVIINISTTNGEVKLSMSNKGPGMTAEEASMLFRIDTPVNKIGNHPAKGSGLGLILSSELIQLNNGSISADSISPEETTFSIKLPAADIN